MIVGHMTKIIFKRYCWNPLDMIVSFWHSAAGASTGVWSGWQSSKKEFVECCCRGIDGVCLWNSTVIMLLFV